MKRVGILTAGGDTPSLNATIYGAVEQANTENVAVVGIIKGFAGLLDPLVPHVRLNPLRTTIPELNPSQGGTILGASRTYVNPDDLQTMAAVGERLNRLNIEGLLCIGGDGTINGMQPLSDFLPCVLAPKTIDNDLGLNYLDEPNEWVRDESSDGGKPCYRRLEGRESISLEDIVNYATPGFATAVFVVAQSIQRIRTTAESHRRIAIIEVMGRQSGYIALGSAYGQPDIILIPEIPFDMAFLEQRIRELYELQKHVVIVIGEGIVDEDGNELGAVERSCDPAGNIQFSGAAEELERRLERVLGDEYFRRLRRHNTAAEAIFTRKVGHTQRGGRPIRFDRYYAARLGGQAMDLLLKGHNNVIATLQWSERTGFFLDSLSANRLRDRWKIIHPRQVHKSMYDAKRLQPSKLGVEYLTSIFTNAIGEEDMEAIRTQLFSPSNLARRYQGMNVDIQKLIEVLK